jgi:aminoglycoside phosphotransferase (APT) family kinase protein
VSTDAAMRRLVHGIRVRTGCDLTYLGQAALGETFGAAFVAWPDGQQGVVTRATVPAARMRQTADVLELARSLGLPVPRLDLIVELDDDVVAVVQERLPGRPAAFVDADVIDALVAANDCLADLLHGRLDVPGPAMYLSESAPVHPRHEMLEQHSRRSRELLRRIRAIGRRQSKEMPGHDLVHPDFTVPNVLLDGDGQVTGMIDWNNGALRGDRRFALVKLLFDLTWDGQGEQGGRHHIQPCALRRLDTILHDTVETELLQTYWAHWTLVMLHWTIRNGDTDAIDLHLRLGERGLS